MAGWGCCGVRWGHSGSRSGPSVKFVGESVSTFLLGLLVEKDKLGDLTRGSGLGSSGLGRWRVGFAVEKAER